MGAGNVGSDALEGDADHQEADGVGAAAQFYDPTGITISPDGRTLYVTDSSNNKVRQVDAVTERYFS